MMTKRILEECDYLVAAKIPHCLCVSPTFMTNAWKAWKAPDTAPDDRKVVVRDVKHAMMFLALPLPVFLRADDEVQALLAFALDSNYPFKHPRAWILTPGIFLPMSQWRVSGATGKPTEISDLPTLRARWSPACLLATMGIDILQELGDPNTWTKYLSADEEAVLTVLHASCTPSSLSQTLDIRDLVPSELCGLGPQWYRMRARVRGESSTVPVPLTVARLIASFLKTTLRGFLLDTI